MAGYDPKEIERKWQQVWAEEKTWEVANPGQPGFDDSQAEVLRAGDAALPLRANPTSATSSATRSATRSPTSAAATASR